MICFVRSCSFGKARMTALFNLDMKTSSLMGRKKQLKPKEKTQLSISPLLEKTNKFLRMLSFVLVKT